MKNPNQVVENLKKNGSLVQIQHHRVVFYPIAAYVNGVDVKCLTKEERKSRIFDIQGKGGKTVVKIEKDGKTFEAKAACGRKEMFNKKRGVQIALGRILKANPELLQK